MKRIFFLILTLTSQPSHAGVWAELCKSIIVDDPYQFEQWSSDALLQFYAQRAAQAIWSGKPDPLLGMMRKQMRINDRDGSPLTVEQQKMLERFQALEKH